MGHHTPGASLSGIFSPVSPTSLPSSDPKQTLQSPRRTLTYLARFALVLGIVALASSGRFSKAKPGPSKCDPFGQAGVLYLDLNQVERTTYRPLDPQCPTSHLLPVVQSILSSDNIDTRKALPWLNNRTVVFVGDSIERFSVDYICELLDGELTLIDMDHPWSPPPFRNGRDELLENDEVVRIWQADGRPHWCQVDQRGLNLNFISFFMYGLADFHEFQAQSAAIFFRPHYYAPVEFMSRIDHWVMGTLERSGLKPDIVEFSSTLWDVLHFSEIDRLSQGTEDGVHAPFPDSTRLDWYQRKLTTALDKIEATFPESTLVWRRGHEVPCGQFAVPCARNSQANAVANYVVEQRLDRWYVNEWGSLIRGHTEFFKDKIHPGEVFRSLWADIELYRLRESFYTKSTKRRHSSLRA